VVGRAGKAELSARAAQPRSVHPCPCMACSGGARLASLRGKYVAACSCASTSGACTARAGGGTLLEGAAAAVARRRGSRRRSFCLPG